MLRVVEDARCRSVNKSNGGFLVNDQTFAYLKYRTKSRTPWTFQFGTDEVAHLNAVDLTFPKTVVAFICGGDGICGLPWFSVRELLAGQAGWISCARRFNEQYGVAGTVGSMRGKVPLHRWPGVVFEE